MLNVDEIEKIIGYEFKNKELLITAFTHSSYSKSSNERLEFLGDSVWQIIVSTYLFNKTTFDEGVLSKYRAKIVCEQNLFRTISKLGLDKYLIVGESFKSLPTKSMSADLCESIIGAIYLDSGNLIKAKEFIFNNIDLDMDFITDYKTALQEIVQGLGKTTQDIRYNTIKIESATNNEFCFESKVYICDVLYGSGIGKTKKEAEQNSAKEAMNKLNLGE